MKLKTNLKEYTFRESLHRDKLDNLYMQNVAGTIHCPKCGSTEIGKHTHIFESPYHNCMYCCREYRMFCKSCGYEQKNAFETLDVAIVGFELDLADD